LIRVEYKGVGVFMYFNKLKEIREERKMTQQSIADLIGVSRSSYVNWENNVVMLPLNIADKLSVILNVNLSYLIGIDMNYSQENVKPLDYSVLLKNLNSLRKEKAYTYEQIATFLDCNKSTCYRYFNNKVSIPIDKLLLLAKLFDMDIDNLCGKK